MHFPIYWFHFRSSATSDSQIQFWRQWIHNFKSFMQIFWSISHVRLLNYEFWLLNLRLRKKHVVFPTFSFSVILLKYWLFHASVKRAINEWSVTHLCTIVHYSCALFPYFIVAIYIFSCCTFSILRSFHVGLFSYGTICMLQCLYSNIFMLHFFSCWTPFMYCTIWCCTFTRCNDFIFHSSLVAVCACCNIFFLQFVHIPLIPEV